MGCVKIIERKRGRVVSEFLKLKVVKRVKMNMKRTIYEFIIQDPYWTGNLQIRMK